jgi:hypothetical protein
MRVGLRVIMVMLFFLLLFFVVAVSALASVHASGSAHIEVVHVVLVPVIAEGLGFSLLIFVDPLLPVGLDVSVLHLLLG